MSLVTSRTALVTQECCSRCRRPSSRCRLKCGGAPATYAGVLLRGEWRDLQASGKRGLELPSVAPHPGPAPLLAGR